MFFFYFFYIALAQGTSWIFLYANNNFLLELLFSIFGLILFYRSIFRNFRTVDIVLSLKIVAITLALFFTIFFGISYIFFGTGLVIKNVDISWIVIVNSVLFAPFVEEIVNRFSLIILTKKRYVTLTSLIISSLIFMFGHQSVLATNGYMSIVYLLLGVCLGIIYIKTQNIWYSVFTHGAYNATVLLIMSIFGS